ncbi:hypothetical protein D3C71_1844030 [compost metagenome]
MQANVEGGMRVDKRIQRQILVELVDLAAQLQAVVVPVENHAANACVSFDQLQQIAAVFGIHQLEVHRSQCGVKLADRLVFIVNARWAHDRDDVHRLLLSVNHQTSITT